MEWNKEIKDEFYENVKVLANEMKILSDIAVEQNIPLVDMILEGYITDEDKIVHIMDRLLDFCQFDKVTIRKFWIV